MGAVFPLAESKQHNGNGVGHHGANGGAPAAVGPVKSYAPATGEFLGEVAVVSKDAVNAVVARARRAQQAWGALPLAERVQRVLRFRDAIVEHAEELVEIISLEAGKPRQEALIQEVMVVADFATYYCKHAARILAPQELSLHLLVHRKSYVSYVPRGVVGVISPWNYPFSIPIVDVFTALIAGNAVVVKPSEVTPLTVKKAKEIYDASGLPEDLFGVVNGFAATGQALIESGIQKLVFTGSVETGKRIGAACGANLVPCVLELGGKAPLIACADAEIERTARAIVFGGFANSGQVCVSVERVYAHKDIYAPLVARVKELTLELRQGDPQRDDVDVGAITFPQQIEIAQRHVDDALKKGAELVTGGQRRSGPGQFFEPTVLANCSHEMTVMTDEIFGPIVPIQRVDSEESALSFANSSHLGLNAYVFTKDRAKGRRLAERIEAGSVMVNDVLVNYATAEAPFGGIKQSGFGRVHGDDALRDMSEKRHVNVDRVPVPARDPLWFPYSGKGYRVMLRGVKALFSGKGIVQRLSKFF